MVNSQKETSFGGLPWRLWLKKRRKELGLSQAELAQRVNYSQEMIGQVERGLHRPSLELAGLLARILEVPAELQDEFKRIARLQPAVTSPKRLLIPGLPATSLIGRATDLDRVLQSLQQNGQRLVTITGPGGVGKSRLAMAVAQELQGAYPDGVFWLELADLHDPQRLLSAVARLLTLKETAGQPLLEALQIALREQRILLVLDNCEHLSGLEPVLPGLLAAPGLQILATSRRRLRIRGEQHFPLAPLALPALTAQPIGDIAAAPAVELFLARAQEVEPDFTLHSGNAAAVSQICVALDGLPLAIELAAVRIRILPPATMLARLHDRLDLLQDGYADLPVRHQTLHAAMAWSYNLLDPAQQLLFRRLSVFTGGFTLAAVAAICYTSGVGESELLSALSALDGWNLLRRISAEDGEPRYGMLATVHEFAAACLEQHAESEQLRHAHLSFYLAQAEQAIAANAGMETPFWLRQLETEQQNIRAAIGWGLTVPAARGSAARVVVALGWFWEARGYWREASQWLSVLLAQDDHQEGAPAAQMLYLAARFAYLLGYYARAQALLEESLVINKERNDVAAQVRSLNTLGWIAYSRAEYRQASVFYNQSLILSRQAGDVTTTATVLNMMGTIFVVLGDQSSGVPLLAESMTIREGQGDRLGMARSLNVLSMAAQHRDDTTAAEMLSMQSLNLFRAVQDPLGQALALITLGSIFIAQSRHDEALQALDEAHHLAQEVGSAWASTMALCYLGWIDLQQGRAASADRLLRESLAFAQLYQIKLSMILAWIGLARLALAAEDRLQAARHLQDAEVLRRELGISLTPFEVRQLEWLNLALA